MWDVHLSAKGPFGTFESKLMGQGKLFTRLAAEAEEEDGERDGDEAKVDDNGVGFGDELDRSGGLFGAEAEGLEDGGDAVAQVRAKEGHGDDVEDNDERVLEAYNHHLPRALFTECGEFTISANGEMKDMEDDESENGQAAPDHDAGRLGCLDGGVVGILGSGRLILLRQEDGEPNVDDEAGEEADAGNPNPHAVEEGVEKFGVFVEGLFTGEDEEVPREVTCQEKNESKAG